MTLIVALTGGFGLLASFVMLKAGLESMAIRYPLALSVAYLFFLVLIWLWLRTKAEVYLDSVKHHSAQSTAPISWASLSFAPWPSAYGTWSMALPADVRRLFGFALSLAQVGDKHDAAKVLKGFGGAGVLEVVEDDVGGNYRAVYTVKFVEAVFVLHCFQKKSKRGIATSKEDMDIIHARLKIAETYVKELRK